MTDWEHRTMEVRKGGKIEWRAIDHMEVKGEFLGSGPSVAVPVLYDGEIIRWVIGSDVPDVFDGPLR